MGKHRQFSKEFKLSVLQELETKRTSEVCREHDLSCSTVCTWKKDYETNPKEAFKGQGNIWKENAKIAEYERLIGRLYSEIDLLKKTYEITKIHLVEERKKKTGSTK